MSAQKLRIGFIGLGNMGSASARNIARGGHTLVVHDINRDAANAFLAQGAQWRVLGDEQQLPRLPEIEIALHRAPGTLAPAVALLEAQLVEAVQMDRPLAARDAQRQDGG